MTAPQTPSPLDPALLRSFRAVADTGSFTRAAASVHLSQSTVSQQIRRLEEQLGCTLLDRSGRHVVTTPEGERLLGYAQRIAALMDEAVAQLAGSAAYSAVRLGVPEDFAARALTPSLAAFAERYPQVRLEVSSGLSRGLWQRFQQGELDLVLVKQRRGSTPGLACWPEPLAWIDSRSRPAFARDPLPLVVFPQDGLYRSEMTHALDAAGRRWRIAYMSASLASLSAAVTDGLGLSLLPRRLIEAGHRVLGAPDGLAAVPDMEVALHARADLGAPAQALTQQLQQVCHQMLAPLPPAGPGSSAP
jgi:DNA-binding transcriptional LysR family regulator